MQTSHFVAKMTLDVLIDRSKKQYNLVRILLFQSIHLTRIYNVMSNIYSVIQPYLGVFDINLLYWML